MRLAWIELRDFRNHEHTAIRALPDGLTVVVGPNGEGKTNLLEACTSCTRCELSAGVVERSRSCATAPTRRTPAESSRPRDGKVLVEVEIPVRGPSRVQVNRSPVRRKRDLRRQVRAVLFGPVRPADRDRGPVEAPRVPGRGADGAVAAQGGAAHRLRPDAAPAEPAAEGVGRAGGAAGARGLGRGAGRGGRGARASRVTSAVERLAPHAADGVLGWLAGYELVVRLPAQRLAARRRRPDGGVPVACSPSAGPTSSQRRTTLVGPHRDDLEPRGARPRAPAPAGSHGETWATALCAPRSGWPRPSPRSSASPRCCSSTTRSARSTPRGATGSRGPCRRPWRPGRRSPSPTRPTCRHGDRRGLGRAGRRRRDRAGGSRMMPHSKG